MIVHEFQKDFATFVVLSKFLTFYIPNANGHNTSYNVESYMYIHIIIATTAKYHNVNCPTIIQHNNSQNIMSTGQCLFNIKSHD